MDQPGANGACIMTPRRVPLIPRRDLAASVLCEAIADALDSMVAMRVIPLSTGQIDAIAAGVARSLAPVHLSVASRGDRETHTLTIGAGVAS